MDVVKLTPNGVGSGVGSGIGSAEALTSKTDELRRIKIDKIKTIGFALFISIHMLNSHAIRP